MNSKKEKIISHCEHSINWVNNLENLSENQWRTPIAEGKWTIAEVVGHLIPWDKYFIERIPYLINESEMSPSPNIEEVNENASANSRRRSKEEIIKEFIEVRENLISKISELDDDLWEKEFSIGNKTLSLYTDFSRLVEHDELHFTQINQLLNE
ncbi:DinB family protein [Halobacillus seohaensis]|uniref:DinB family protein n=1 Tax=Halobacillus seohaensis TaxID=447421 RepID=A0ABW2EMG0_9BACI